MRRLQVNDMVVLNVDVFNDGTYPGVARGYLMAKQGEPGLISGCDDHIHDRPVYDVHLTNIDIVVRCREEQLTLESEPLVASRFAPHDKVRIKKPLVIHARTVAKTGSVATIASVIPGDFSMEYHIRIGARCFRVPEHVLGRTGEDYASE